MLHTYCTLRDIYVLYSPPAESPTGPYSPLSYPIKFWKFYCRSERVNFQDVRSDA